MSKIAVIGAGAEVGGREQTGAGLTDHGLGVGQVGGGEVCQP